MPTSGRTASWQELTTRIRSESTSSPKEGRGSCHPAPVVTPAQGQLKRSRRVFDPPSFHNLGTQCNATQRNTTQHAQPWKSNIYLFYLSMTPDLKLNCCNRPTLCSRRPSDDLPPNRPLSHREDRHRRHLKLTPSPLRHNTNHGGLRSSSSASTSSRRPIRVPLNSRRSSSSNRRIQLVDHENCQDGPVTHRYGDHPGGRAGRHVEHRSSGHYSVSE